MGYHTDFDGSITINLRPNEDYDQVSNRIKELLKINGLAGMGVFVQPDSENNIEIRISDSWKNYNAELETFLHCVVSEYPSAKGRIEAMGEDRDDRWAIEVKESRVEIIELEFTEKSRRIWQAKKD